MGTDVDRWDEGGFRVVLVNVFGDDFECFAAVVNDGVPFKEDTCVDPSVMVVVVRALVPPRRIVEDLDIVYVSL